MRENVKDVLNQARFGGLEVKITLFFYNMTNLYAFLSMTEDHKAKCDMQYQLKGQCPDYAHARASSVFSSTDNRTVILTQQDFLLDRTTDSDLLFTFSSNILDFRRSLSSYLKFSSRHKDSLQFYQKSCSAHFKNSFSNVKLVSAVNCSKSSNICLIYCRSSLKHLKDINKNVISTL